MKPNAHLVSAMQPLVEAVNHNAKLTAKLRTALLSAMLGENEIKSVGELACACHCDRTTLWRHWREGIGSDVSPKEVLQVIRLRRSLATGTPIKKGSQTRATLIKRFGIIPSDQLNVLELINLSRLHQKLIAALSGAFADS